MSPRWLTIVGIGDGGFATLTPEARAALGTATTIFGGQRHLAMLGEHRANQRHRGGDSLARPSPLHLGE